MPEERSIMGIRNLPFPIWKRNNTRSLLEAAANKLSSVRKGKNGSAIPPPSHTAERKRAARRRGRWTLGKKHTAKGGRKTRRRS